MGFRREKQGAGRLAGCLVVVGVTALDFGLGAPSAQAAAVGGAGNLALTISCDGAGSNEINWSANFTGMLASHTYTFLFAEDIPGNQGDAVPKIPVHFATDAGGACSTDPVQAININNSDGGPGPLHYYVGDSYPRSISDGATTMLSGTAVVQDGVGPCGGTTTSAAPRPMPRRPRRRRRAPRRP